MRAGDVAWVQPEAFPADAEFPQLATASDPERMLEQFRRHLRVRPGRRVEIQGCQPFRFRCRQSESRCVLQYTLRVRDAETGREWDQWVTGLIYATAGEAERVEQKMRAEAAGELPEPWGAFDPVVGIPELDMVVEVFPFDRRLPQLRQVLNGGARGLEPVWRAELGPGQWEVAEPRIEPARYRTELGAVLRCTTTAREMTTDRRQTLRCYLKVYRNARGRETLELLRSWAENGSNGRPFALTRPIAYLDDLHTLVLEEAPGKSLEEMLRGDQALDTLRSVARALAAFHQDDLGITRTHTLEDQVGQLTRASNVIQWACPEVRVEVRDITSEVVSGLVEVPPAPLHGDLKVDHIFLDSGRVIFIDLDGTALGDPVRDPAHFCSYLTSGVGLEWMSRDHARELAAVFVQEYFEHVPRSWRRQFQLHYAGALVEVACGIFHQQRAHWLERAEAAIAEARRAVAGEGTLGVEAQPVLVPRAAGRRGRHADWSVSLDRDRAGNAPLLPSDLALMRILWARGEATAKDLTERLARSPARLTVATRLGRLEERGLVTHRTEGHQFVYRAAVGQAEAQRSFVESFVSLAEELFDGNMAALVCQLIQTRDVDAVGLAQVMALLESRGQAGDR